MKLCFGISQNRLMKEVFQKNIETEFLAFTTDAEWKKLIKTVVHRCAKIATGNFINICN